MRNTVTESSRDIWDSYWRKQASTSHVDHVPQIIGTIQKHLSPRGCLALEIGSGSGRDSAALASLGAKVIGLDRSATALHSARRTMRQTHASLALTQADARQLPFAAGTFDLVFHQGFLEHFRDPVPLLCEQRRVLRKGGYMLVDVPQRYNLYTLYKRYRISRARWDCGGWETEFSYRGLSRLLVECGLEPVDAYGRDVFPYLVSLRNQLERLERLVFGRRGFSPAIWRLYDASWHSLERSALGRNTLMCIGILAQKT